MQQQSEHAWWVQKVVPFSIPHRALRPKPTRRRGCGRGCGLRCHSPALSVPLFWPLDGVSVLGGCSRGHGIEGEGGRSGADLVHRSVLRCLVCESRLALLLLGCFLRERRQSSSAVATKATATAQSPKAKKKQRGKVQPRTIQGSRRPWTQRSARGKKKKQAWFMEWRKRRGRRRRRWRRRRRRCRLAASAFEGTNSALLFRCQHESSSRTLDKRRSTRMVIKRQRY